MESSYDYPAKNAVREMWMRFLPTSFSKPVRGIYLPGVTNLELQGYLEKGIRSEHLIGAERLPVLQDRIDMQGHPITLVRGCIRDAVQLVRDQRWFPVTFANFDFDGSYHSNMEDVLSVFSVFPSDDAAYLAVSSYSARDDEALLQGIVNISKFYSAFESRSRFWRAYGKMMSRYEAVRKQLVNSRTEDYAHLSRELGFLWWIALVMGAIENRSGDVWTVNESYMQTFDDLLREITQRALEHIGDEREFRVLCDPRLGERLRARSCFLWPDRFEHVMWYTARHQPMCTWMLRLQPLRAEESRPTHYEIAEQLWNMAVKTPLVYIDQEGTKISFD